MTSVYVLPCPRPGLKAPHDHLCKNDPKLTAFDDWHICENILPDGKPCGFVWIQSLKGARKIEVKTPIEKAEGESLATPAAKFDSVVIPEA